MTPALLSSFAPSKGENPIPVSAWSSGGEVARIVRANHLAGKAGKFDGWKVAVSKRFDPGIGTICGRLPERKGVKDIGRRREACAVEGREGIRYTGKRRLKEKNEEYKR